MNKEEFLEAFRAEFEDTDPHEIVLQTEFRNLEDWSSIVGMGLIVMAQERYGVQMSPTDLRGCKTVEEVYNFISANSKQ
ncbi:MAG: acyl carrier protein [Bacteroidales bacterium]|nr:acyl carrier protein [Bacteroidales bacterium]